MYRHFTRPAPTCGAVWHILAHVYMFYFRCILAERHSVSTPSVRDCPVLFVIHSVFFHFFPINGYIQNIHNDECPQRVMESTLLL